MVNLSCVVASTGYGIVGLNILHSLVKIGAQPALFPIGQIEAPPEYHPAISYSLNNARFYNKEAHSVRVYHQHSLAEHVGKGLHCGFPIFELDRFTEVELNHLNSLDLIFTPSAWSKDILEKNKVYPEKIVVPFGVDQSLFKPGGVERERQHTVFLNVGKWEVRKGHKELCEAFNRAFTPKDDVELVMHSYNPCHTKNPNYNQEWVRYFLTSEMGKAGKIKIVDGRLSTQKEVRDLMASADCGVFPSKAEGWNLPLLEMLAMDKTVICTDNTAHTQFARDYNASLIDTPEMEDAFDGEWFYGQGRWHAFGEPQMNQLVKYMREIHSRKLFDSVGQVAASVSHLTWENTARLIMERLNVCHS